MLLCTRSSKPAIDCSCIYCEGKYNKVLQTRTFLFKHTIVFTGVKNINWQHCCTTHKANKFIRIIQITKKTYHNGSFFSYKKQCFYWFVQLAATTRHEKTFYNDMWNTQRFLSYRMERTLNWVKLSTHGHLTGWHPMVMRVLEMKIDYLECAYGTRYYVINKVNGDINAIHDESLELTGV